MVDVAREDDRAANSEAQHQAAADDVLVRALAGGASRLPLTGRTDHAVRGLRIDLVGLGAVLDVRAVGRVVEQVAPCARAVCLAELALQLGGAGEAARAPL